MKEVYVMHLVLDMHSCTMYIECMSDMVLRGVEEELVRKVRAAAVLCGISLKDWVMQACEVRLRQEVGIKQEYRRVPVPEGVYNATRKVEGAKAGKSAEMQVRGEKGEGSVLSEAPRVRAGRESGSGIAVVKPEHSEEAEKPGRIAGATGPNGEPLIPGEKCQLCHSGVYVASATDASAKKWKCVGPRTHTMSPKEKEKT